MTIHLRTAASVIRSILVPFAVYLAALVAASPGAAAPDVTCSTITHSFSGTANNLTIASGEHCSVAAATITHDLIVKQNASVHVERTTIGNDLVATQPQSVQSGHNSGSSPGGPVSVGHDVRITGTPTGVPESFDGLCYLTVGHDLRMTNRMVLDGSGIGDNCVAHGLKANTIKHDLVVTDSSTRIGFTGSPAAIEVGGNQVGHDLVFKGNKAVPGARLEVANNVVDHDAVCAANSPAPTWDASDGSNVVAHTNSC
jgi:hypothetical protein